MIQTRYNKKRHSYLVTIDGHKYEWSISGYYVQIYPDRWVYYSNIKQTASRFASIHHGKKFMKEFTAGDIYVNIPSGDYTCIKAENIKIDIIFYAIPKEEKITAMIRKNDKTYTYNYNRLSRYYTYQVLADPKGTINDIITDIQLDMKFMGF